MIPTELIIAAFKATLDLSDKVTGKFDDEKYAEAIIKLYGKEPTYNELDAQVEVIKSDPELSPKEKRELLGAISVQKDAARKRELEIKAKCAEIIDNGVAKKGEVATKIVVVIFKTLLTGGLALIPLLLGGHDEDAEDPGDCDDNDENAA